MDRDFANPEYTHVVLVTGSRSWDDEAGMRHSFNQLWLRWGIAAVTRPLLISGSAFRGADAIAERLWQAAGPPVRRVPADWDRFGRSAGYKRNQLMVDQLVELRGRGSQVVCASFLDLCLTASCVTRSENQLMPLQPGHFSHGTIHCRSRAELAGIELSDTFRR